MPELKAVKVAVDALHNEMGYLRAETRGSIDSLHTEMKLRDEKLEQFIRSGDEKLEQLIRSGDEKLEQLIRTGDERNERAFSGLERKLDDTIEIRERLAAIEARLPRQ